MRVSCSSNSRLPSRLVLEWIRRNLRSSRIPSRHSVSPLSGKQQTAVIGPEILQYAVHDLGAYFLEILFFLDALDNPVESRKRPDVLFEELVHFADGIPVAVDDPVIEISLLGGQTGFQRLVVLGHFFDFAVIPGIIDQDGLDLGANSCPLSP